MFWGTDLFQNRTGQGLTATHAYENGRFSVWYHGRVRMTWSVADTGIHHSNYNWNTPSAPKRAFGSEQRGSPPRQ